MAHQYPEARHITDQAITTALELAPGTMFKVEDVAAPEVSEDTIAHIHEYVGILFHEWQEKHSNEARRISKAGETIEYVRL